MACKVLKGVKVGLAKLDDEKVREIRNSNLPNYELALYLGVNPSQVSRVKNGKSWRHVK